MTLETLAIARDWAVIILAIEAILIAALLLYVGLEAYRAMRRVRPKVRQGLHGARQAVVRASEGTRRGVLFSARPFVVANSVGAGIRVGWAAWWRSLLRRR
jgi:hypothetical protein